MPAGLLEVIDNDLIEYYICERQQFKTFELRALEISLILKFGTREAKSDFFNSVVKM